MRVALLTTETPHHTYYGLKLAERFPLSTVVLETHRLEAPFETSHPFEALRDEYERDVLLASCEAGLGDIADTVVVDTANDSVPMLRRVRPDVLLVFGTGLLRPPVLAIAPGACLNLHGGNPEEYRGLDAHLWAIYHRDFTNLLTTIHHIDEDLDTGDIVYREPLRITRETELFKLRALTTEACVDLSLRALAALTAGSLPRVRQQQRGRYYSFMPSVLKERCLVEWNRYRSTL